MLPSYCMQVIFKWNRFSGQGQVVNFDEVHEAVNQKPTSLYRFQAYAVLMGCDYAESLHGIGPTLSEKFISQVADNDIFKVSLKCLF